MSVVAKNKQINLFTLIMITVIAVDSLRSIPLSAQYGFSLVFYYLLGAVVFLIPSALVSAELASTFPKTGGLYVWIKEAFGDTTSMDEFSIKDVYYDCVDSGLKGKG